MKKEAKKNYPIIAEPELIDALRLRDKLTELKKTAREVEAELDNIEKGIMDRLRSGAVITGRLTATIDIVTGSIRPEWKEIYLHHMESEHSIAKKQAEENARGTCTPRTSEKLVIGFGNKS